MVTFSVMFFSSAPNARDRYGLVLDAAKLADELGFSAVWVPERHFDDFGGIFPNPAVIAAALATTTSRIQIRAGSVITPLHDIIRVAEEWSIVDNLSGGRVSLSIGSGWNANDFALQPDRYATRRDVMWEQLDELRTLWHGGKIERLNGVGELIAISIQPRPVQPDLPIWATSGGTTATYQLAGRNGANVLTHLIGQDLPVLTANIAAYRQELGDDRGIVTLMVHTYVGDDNEDVRSAVYQPMREYLRSSLSLRQSEMAGRGQANVSAAADDEELVNEMLDVAFDKYYERGSLLGSPEKVRGLITELEQAGVDEVACLVDFGLPAPQVLAGLRRFAHHFIGAADE